MKKILFLVTMLLFVSSLTAVADEVPRMSKKDLKAQLDSDEIVIMDARSGKDWKSSEFKIKGAIRTHLDNIDEWIDTIPKDKKLVVYCA
ncbi:MAG: hypothetical protein D3924_15840 [Candidatus Electrothrix sp. AR4]|nr:hypothetical protein [Candidatus Electrothrix sp. AR4]